MNEVSTKHAVNLSMNSLIFLLGLAQVVSVNVESWHVLTDSPGWFYLKTTTLYMPIITYSTVDRKKEREWKTGKVAHSPFVRGATKLGFGLDLLSPSLTPLKIIPTSGSRQSEIWGISL